MSSLQALLEKGYFPRELPPPFNTDTFASFAFSHGAAWNTKSWQMKMSMTTTSAQGEPKLPQTAVESLVVVGDSSRKGNLRTFSSLTGSRRRRRHPPLVGH